MDWIWKLIHDDGHDYQGHTLWVKEDTREDIEPDEFSEGPATVWIGEALRNPDESSRGPARLELEGLKEIVFRAGDHVLDAKVSVFLERKGEPGEVHLSAGCALFLARMLELPVRVIDPFLPVGGLALETPERPPEDSLPRRL